jgi:hypothetical protein
VTGVVALLALGLGGARLYGNLANGAETARPSAVVRDWRDLGRDGIVLGAPEASVTLVMYSDFTCVHCRAAAPAVKALREEFGSSLRFVYRNAPLGQSSRLPALAAVCGHEQGAFESVYDHLLLSSAGFRMVDSLEVPPQLGVQDPERFRKCLVSGHADSAIARDTIEAMKVGVSGTPAFLVDSLMFHGNVGEKTLRDAIVMSLGERPSLYRRLRELFSARSFRQDLAMNR